MRNRQGSPIFKYRKYLDLARRLPEVSRTTIGSGGSIASAFGTGKTNFGNVWPMPRLTGRSGDTWNTGSAKFTRSENAVVIAECREFGASLLA
jgi:hypothetical protein